MQPAYLPVGKQGAKKRKRTGFRCKECFIFQKKSNFAGDRIYFRKIVQCTDMKIFNRERVRTFIRGCRLGDYLRQFSIVTGGVIVTFWGSSLITEHTLQKQVRTTMRLMTEEMRYNLHAVRQMRKLTGKDLHMASMLVENEMDLKHIPEDTLQAYSTFFSNLSDFRYKQDALEVLKGSSQMQYIADKQMLQDILQTYYSLAELKTNLKDYYELKSKILYEVIFFSGRTKEEVIHYMSFSFPRQVSYLMSNPNFLSFVITVPGFTDWGAMDRLEEELTKQIEFLEKTY